MSAFVVTDSHINAILTALKMVGHTLYVPRAGNDFERQFSMDEAGLTALGQMLYAANVESVLYRYPQDKPDDYAPATAFRFKSTKPVSALAAMKLCQSLDYQCCEPPEWSTCTAKRALDAIVWSMISKLPGYEAAPWALHDA